MNEPTFNCAICHERIEGWVMDHLRVMHPDWETGGGARVDPAVYHAADWNGGALCGECSKPFEEGDIYTHIPEGKAGDGTPIMLVVCFDCGVKAVVA